MKNFKKIQFPIFCLAIFIISITSCDDYAQPTPQPPPGFTDTLFQSQEFLNYWYFKEGSWWVYKRVDTVAEIYDTAIVTKTLEDYMFSKYLKPYATERYRMFVSHSSEYLDKTGNDIIYRSGIPNVLGVDEGGEYFGGSTYLWWPIEIGSHGATITHDTNDLKTISGMYTNVVHTSIRNDHHHWLSKNYGLIKFQFEEGDVWELVSSHLIK